VPGPERARLDSAHVQRLYWSVVTLAIRPLWMDMLRALRLEPFRI